MKYHTITTDHFEITSTNNDSTDLVFIVIADLFQSITHYSNTISALHSIGSVVWITPKLNGQHCESWTPSIAAISEQLYEHISIKTEDNRILITHGLGRQIASNILVKYKYCFHCSPVFHDNQTQWLLRWTQCMFWINQNPATALENLLHSHWRDTNKFPPDEPVPWIHTDLEIQNHFNRRLSWKTWKHIFKIMKTSHLIQQKSHWFIGGSSPHCVSSIKGLTSLQGSSEIILWKIFPELRNEMLMATNVIQEITTRSRE